MLLAAPVFRGGRLEKAIRALMIITGALCILGLAWLPFSPQQATVIGILIGGSRSNCVSLQRTSSHASTPMQRCLQLKGMLIAGAARSAAHLRIFSGLHT
jgi:hypothetical protein